MNNQSLSIMLISSEMMREEEMFLDVLRTEWLGFISIPMFWEFIIYSSTFLSLSIFFMYLRMF